MRLREVSVKVLSSANSEPFLPIRIYLSRRWLMGRWTIHVLSKQGLYALSYVCAFVAVFQAHQYEIIINKYLTVAVLKKSKLTRLAIKHIQKKNKEKNTEKKFPFNQSFNLSVRSLTYRSV